MSIKFDSHNLNKNIQKYGEQLEAMGGKHRYTLNDLFTNEFIKRSSNFNTFEQMFLASGLKSVEELDSTQWDTFVANNSRFSGWSEMHQVGLDEWVSRKFNH